MSVFNLCVVLDEFLEICDSRAPKYVIRAFIICLYFFIISVFEIEEKVHCVDKINIHPYHFLKTVQKGPTLAIKWNKENRANHSLIILPLVLCASRHLYQNWVLDNPIYSSLF